MEGPREFAEAEGQAVQREVDVGARIAQALGGLAEVDGEGGGELGIGGVEGLAELEELLARGVGCEGGVACQGDDGAGGGSAGEVDAGFGCGEVQAGIVGGGFERWGGCLDGCAHGVLSVSGSYLKERASLCGNRRHFLAGLILPLFAVDWPRFAGARGLGLEGALEEGGGGLVGGKPVLVEQEAVDFVGEDEFFDGNVTGAQGLGEDGGLGVGDVGVVIAVDEKDGRTPEVDGGDGGAGAGFGGDGVLLGEGTLLPVGGVVFEVPVVDAVEVDAGGEEVRVARQGEGGEIAAVAAAPDADAFGVDAGKERRYFAAARTSLYSAPPSAPVCLHSRKSRP